MDKDDIIKLPHSHLRQRSQKIGIVGEETLQLARDMQAATLDWEDSREHEVGVALAAVQVDKMLRVVVIREDFDNKDNRNFNVFINPEITKYEGDEVEDFEGCLSIPDVYGKVKRSHKVRIKALNIEGKPIRLTVEGFLARVFQHEIDHTKGIVFIDHIKDNPDVFYKIEENGHLEPLDYEKEVKTNTALWEEA